MVNSLFPQRVKERQRQTEALRAEGPLDQSPVSGQPSTSRLFDNELIWEGDLSPDSDLGVEDFEDSLTLLFGSPVSHSLDASSYGLLPLPPSVRSIPSYLMPLAPESSSLPPPLSSFLPSGLTPPPMNILQPPRSPTPPTSLSPVPPPPPTSGGSQVSGSEWAPSGPVPFPSTSFLASLAVSGRLPPPQPLSATRSGSNSRRGYQGTAERQGEFENGRMRRDEALEELRIFGPSHSRPSFERGAGRSWRTCPWPNAVEEMGRTGGSRLDYPRVSRDWVRDIDRDLRRMALALERFNWRTSIVGRPFGPANGTHGQNTEDWTVGPGRPMCTNRDGRRAGVRELVRRRHGQHTGGQGWQSRRPRQIGRQGAGGQRGGAGFGLAPEGRRSHDGYGPRYGGHRTDDTRSQWNGSNRVQGLYWQESGNRDCNARRPRGRDWRRHDAYGAENGHGASHVLCRRTNGGQGSDEYGQEVGGRQRRSGHIERSGGLPSYELYEPGRETFPWGDGGDSADLENDTV